MFGAGVSNKLIKQRAQLYRQLRTFFYDRQVVEVDVPVIGQRTVTDVFIESLELDVGKKRHYLQTSPEFFMKRLLSSDAESIYYLGKAFRKDESGVRHRPEFTLLEWYRIGFDDNDLIDEIQCLLSSLKPGLDCSVRDYGEYFMEVSGLCPHSCELKDLRSYALKNTSYMGELESKAEWLDLIFTHCIEPCLPSGLVILKNYPKEQAALAKTSIDSSGVRVARRFEVFFDGLELANGYWELTDPVEQLARFQSDRERRRAMGLKIPEIDLRFMAAVELGLPECAGVALGVDRLLMALTGSKDIADVLAFADC